MWGHSRAVQVRSATHCTRRDVSRMAGLWSHCVQLESYMMDDKSSAWERFLPARFNSLWLQALNIAPAPKTVSEATQKPTVPSVAAEWCDVHQKSFEHVWNWKPLLCLILLSDYHRLLICIFATLQTFNYNPSPLFLDKCSQLRRIVKTAGIYRCSPESTLDYTGFWLVLFCPFTLTTFLLCRDFTVNHQHCQDAPQASLPVVCILLL